jgi:hypothetical protein
MPFFFRSVVLCINDNRWGGVGVWADNNLKEAIKVWWKNNNSAGHESLPLVFWASWRKRNEMIFNNASDAPLQVFYKIQHVYEGLKKEIPIKVLKQVGVLHIDKSHSWCFLHCASKGNPSRCSAGRVLCISENQLYTFTCRLG